MISYALIKLFTFFFLSADEEIVLEFFYQVSQVKNTRESVFSLATAHAVVNKLVLC